MFPRKRVFVFVLLLCHALPSLRGELRDWTRISDGKRISAEFVALKDANTVTVKTAAGRTYNIPLSRLSPEDVAYAKEEAAKMSRPGGASKDAKPLPEGEIVVTLSGVHLCCGECVEAVARIGSDPKAFLPDGVEIVGDRGSGTIVVKAPNGRVAVAALEAVSAAGFHGTSDHDVVGIADLEKKASSTDEMVVRGAHLCCGGCVRAFKKAVESVEGVEACDARSGSTEVQVSGKRFKPYEVMMALRGAGFGGSIQ